MRTLPQGRNLPSRGTLPQRIAAGAALGHEVTFVSGDTHITVPWSEVHADARRMAAVLADRGAGPGERVAILGPTSRALVTAIQAVWLTGATVVVLPLPMRMGSIEEFVGQTRRRNADAQVCLVVVDHDLLPFIDEQPGDPPVVDLGVLAAADGDPFDGPPPVPDAAAIMQFTSGSTSDPKGVVLPHRAVCANLDAIATAAALDVEADVLVSWLPLYHDMGLVGLLTLSMSTGTRLVLGAPQDFLASPRRWMEWVSTYGGTATAGPNFSYVLATRALRRAAKEGQDLDLSSLRVVLNGAEPIDPDSVRDFVDASGRFGMNPGAVFPAFGMAEVAIAGTFPEPGRGLVVDAVDRRVLETERYAAPVDPSSPTARSFALLGTAVPGLEIRIVDAATGRERLEREVGELQIRGSSVCSGYHGRPELDAEVFHDGWLRTGDLGYLVGGELVLCGRIKDVIIVGGRNVFPEDVERACHRVEGVRAGNVIAFGVEAARGREGLVVVAESKAPESEPVRRSVLRRVREAVGVPAKDVVLVAPGSLPKTSSGKLQRSLCRDQYLGRQLQPL
jgi:fatty-acyl-CoA synthase